MAGLPPKYIRQKFLDIVGPNELDKYLKDLESLSNKKGGGYSQAYEDDQNYILREVDDQTVMQNILQLGGFTNRKKKVSPLDMKYGKYCKSVDTDPDCEHRALELNVIYDTIQSVPKGKVKPKQWQQAISKFFDFTLCCPELFNEKIPESVFRVQIEKTLETINRHDQMLQYAFEYVWPIWINEKDRTFDRELYKNYIDFMREKDQRTKEKLLTNLKKEITKKESQGNINSGTKWLTTAIYISIFKAAKYMVKH